MLERETTLENFTLKYIHSLWIFGMEQYETNDFYFVYNCI